MKESANNFKRQSIRFDADPNTLVYIKRSGSDGEEIDSIGLVTTEAGKGFGCIVLNSACPEKDELCLVKVGDLHAMKAKVAYAEDLDEHSKKLGFQYVD